MTLSITVSTDLRCQGLAVCCLLISFCGCSYAMVGFFSPLTSLAYSPRITVLDMDGNEKYVPDIAIPVATSVSFICRANGVIKSDFVWKKASFSSQDYFEVQQSKLVVIDRKNGESKITFTETSFDKAGIYQCETSIYSARVNLHVYGSNGPFLSIMCLLVVDSGGTDVKSIPVTKDFYQVSITHNVPDLSIHPTAFCKFQVGQNGVNYATVRWYGEGLTQYRDMFHVTEYKDAATGVIYSNLTMRVTCKSFFISLLSAIFAVSNPVLS